MAAEVVRRRQAAHGTPAAGQAHGNPGQLKICPAGAVHAAMHLGLVHCMDKLSSQAAPLTSGGQQAQSRTAGHRLLLLRLRAHDHLLPAGHLHLGGRLRGGQGWRCRSSHQLAQVGPAPQRGERAARGAARPANPRSSVCGAAPRLHVPPVRTASREVCRACMFHAVERPIGAGTGLGAMGGGAANRGTPSATRKEQKSVWMREGPMQAAMAPIAPSAAASMSVGEILQPELASAAFVPSAPHCQKPF